MSSCRWPNFHDHIFCEACSIPRTSCHAAIVCEMEILRCRKRMGLESFAHHEWHKSSAKSRKGIFAAAASDALEAKHCCCCCWDSCAQLRISDSIIHQIRRLRLGAPKVSDVAAVRPSQVRSGWYFLGNSMPAIPNQLSHRHFHYHLRCQCVFGGRISGVWASIWQAEAHTVAACESNVYRLHWERPLGHSSYGQCSNRDTKSPIDGMCVSDPCCCFRRSTRLLSVVDLLPFLDWPQPTKRTTKTMVTTMNVLWQSRIAVVSLALLRHQHPPRRYRPSRMQHFRCVSSICAPDRWRCSCCPRPFQRRPRTERSPP